MDRVGRSERVRLLGQVSGGLAHQMRNAVTGARLAVQLHAQSCAGGDAEALQVAERQLHGMPQLDRASGTAAVAACT